MATGNQRVKTPSGWNATRGAWVKTGAQTWKAVEQVYIKTPSGWNNASGQELVQSPYPYIANARQPGTYQNRQPSTYQNTGRTPVIYQVSYRVPSTYQNRQPSTYQVDYRVPSTYQVSYRVPSTYQNRQPSTYQVSYQIPFTYQGQYRVPSTYQNRQPSTYQVSYRIPSTYQVSYRVPSTYRASYRVPFTYQARTPGTYPANAQQPSNYNASYRVPYIANARQPAIYIASYRVPYIANARQPYIANARYPAIYIASARQPVIASGRSPFTYQASYRYGGRLPAAYPYVQPSPPFGGGGCFTANTMVWMSDSVPKEISKVAVGDMVYSWNFRLGKLERVSVIDVMEPRQSIVYKIELESGHDIEVTGGHPFCVEEQGWKVVSMEDYKKEVEDGNTWDSEEVKGEIKVGDYIMDVNNALLDQDLHESKVKSITKLEEQTVYHFGVDGESHNFFANGMMVHNFQEKR